MNWSEIECKMWKSRIESDDAKKLAKKIYQIKVSILTIKWILGYQNIIENERIDIEIKWIIIKQTDKTRIKWI
jgi:hypothetical protein